ncbi:hypothetical protein [Occallatibacter savannae]|uniref:hypothetical protein n=1 Tax=Occallatibacter savannae TaxID=1002691 RepID=UPI000D686ADF|nr:hypothetical protein [Occallatibacter savannae]
MGLRRILVLLSIAALASCTSQAQNVVQKYWSDNYGVSVPAPDGKFYQYSRLAKAQPDECFDPSNPTLSQQSFFANYPNDLDPTTVVNGACTNSLSRKPGQLKTNQAYLWGFTSWGHDLWFGTIANTLCLVAEGMGAANFAMNTVECQGLAQDVRPPRIFLYDTKTAQLTDMTPQVFNSINPADKYNLMHTTGLRSAGSLGDVVLIAGIAQGGVSMFAFNGRTRTFIGSAFYNGSDAAHPKYTNIRQWLVTNNNLYVGVAGNTVNQIGFGATSGYILHWIGSAANPFNFETVGILNADPAYLARYQDRLFVTTWGGNQSGPGGTDTAYGTQLYMSPGISKIGTATAAQWKPIWKYSDYEVEPSGAMGGGALAAHDGWLYWSTMTPPGAQAQAFASMYKNAPSDYAFLGSYRPTAMFRGKFLDSATPQIQLLYGNQRLPKYVEQGTTSRCTNTGPTCEWAIVPNNMSGTPALYGLAGYNNPFNSYTWWMTTYNGELFIGTFDWSYILFESLFDLTNGQQSTAALPDLDLGAASISTADANTIPPEVIAAAREFEGADLLRIHSSSDPAYVVDLDGMGNFSNYGVRNMLQLGSQLYIGTANPFNLLNPPINANYEDQLGGWELLHMKPTDLWYQTYCSAYTATTMPSYCVQPTTP